MGIVTLGNRAYEGINRVLGLFGGQTIGNIDIDAAIPVHDLTTIVQADQIGYWIYSGESTTGAGTERIQASFYDASEWSEILTPSGEVLAPGTDADMPPQDHDLYILGGGISSDGNLSSGHITVVSTVGSTFNHTYPLGTQWDAEVASTAGVFDLCPTNEPNWAQRLPYRLPTSDELVFVIAWAAAGIAAWNIYVMTAPPGVITRAF